MRSDLPSFSVVIPLYNKAKYIERAVRSVLDQTEADFELIVVDDGSTDESAQVVRGMNDPRIRLVVQANGGETAARNRGIAESRARYIAFLDADDEWRPGFLHVISELIAAFPSAGLYATSYSFVNSRGEQQAILPESSPGWEGILPDYFRLARLGRPPVTASSVCIRRDVLDAVGGFPPGIRRGGDLFTWAKIALKYPIAYRNVDCARYHLVEGSACAFVVKPEYRADWSLLLDGGGGGTVLPPSAVDYFDWELLNQARSCIALGRGGEGRGFLRKCRGPSWRLRKLLLGALSFLPPPIITAAVRVRRNWQRTA